MQQPGSSAHEPGMTTPPLPAPLPAARPCASCPYRCDVPSGVWDDSEYAKLERFDAPTGSQPPGLFYCHSRDSRLCAGWVATHDMEESLAVRFAMLDGRLDGDMVEALIDYTTDVPTFDSGRAAAEHGRRDLEAPSDRARDVIDKVDRILTRHGEAPQVRRDRTGGTEERRDRG